MVFWWCLAVYHPLALFLVGKHPTPPRQVPSLVLWLWGAWICLFQWWVLSGWCLCFIRLVLVCRIFGACLWEHAYQHEQIPPTGLQDRWGTSQHTQGGHQPVFVALGGFDLSFSMMGFVRLLYARYPAGDCTAGIFGGIGHIVWLLFDMNKTTHSSNSCCAAPQHMWVGLNPLFMVVVSFDSSLQWWVLSGWHM